jgi:predicted transcriptional regulator
MELTKEEYAALHWIARNGLMDFERLSLNIDLKKARAIIAKLEKDNLIQTTPRADKIYGFIETELGNKILEDKKYRHWNVELGN